MTFKVLHLKCNDFSAKIVLKNRCAYIKNVEKCCSCKNLAVHMDDNHLFAVSVAVRERLEQF